MFRCSLLAALLLLGAAFPVSAQTTWFVDAAAPGPGTGSSLDPFPTIQQGVAAALSGDTVQVAAGNYAGTVSITSNDIEIVGAGPGLSILTATGQDAGFSATSAPPGPRIEDLRIAGFTVEGASRWQVVLWRCDRPVLEDLELIGLGRNVPSPSPGTTAVTGLNLAEVIDANVTRLSARANYAGGVAISGGSGGNALRDLNLSDNVGDTAGFASINLWTAPGVSVGGGSNAVQFAGNNQISASPRGLLLEDTPVGIIDLAGGATINFSFVGVPVARYGLGQVLGLDSFLDDAALRFRATGGEPLLPTGEAFFSDFESARTAASFATAPLTVLVFDRSESDYEVGVGLSLQYAIDNVPLSSRVFVHPGSYTGPFVLARAIELFGAQHGVDARGRVAGVLNSSTEAVLGSPAGLVLDVQSGAAGACIDGFAFDVGTVLALECSSGPLDGLAIRNCHFEPALVGPIRFSAGGDDIDMERNVVRATAGTGPAIALSKAATLRGLHLRSNHITRVGFGSIFDSGFFADRIQQIEASSQRSPEFVDNRFEGHGTGLFAGQAAIHDALIADNLFLAHRVDGASGGFQDCNFRGNLFDGNAESGLFLTGFGGTLDPARGAQRCVLIDNVFQANGAEALFFSSQQFAGTIATNVAHGNSFVGNGAGAAYFGAESIDATLNWWGDVRGPSGDGSGSGDAAFGVLFDPWLSCPPMAGQYAAGEAVSLAVGDLNADSFFDIAIADRAGDAVRVRWNDTFASFPTETVLNLSAGDAPSAVDIGEVLIAATRGIAVACTNGPRVRLLDVNLGAIADLPLPGFAPIALRVLALDGATQDDIVVALAGDALGGAGLAVALGASSFSMLPAPVGGAWPAVLSFAALDLDGDLDLDLAALVAPNAAQPTPPGDIVLYLNDGFGSFSYASALSLALQLGETPRALAAGDMDRDGRLDLVASIAATAAGRLAYMRSLGAASFAALMNETLSYEPAALVIGDLRVDSQPGFFADTEVAVLAPDEGLVAIHAGFDGAAFQRFEACTAGVHPTAIAMRNLEQVDCLPDLMLLDDVGEQLIVHLTGASALVRNYGVGCAGGPGIPHATSIGRPIFGNTSFAIAIEDTAASAPVALMVGAGTGLGTCATFLLDLPLFFFPGVADPSGATALTTPIPADPFVECAQLYMQWIVIDPAGSFLGGPFALSDGLRVRVGD